VKRDDGDEKLEEWKKERLLEKRMSPSTSGPITLESLMKYMTDWIGKTRRNNPLRRKAAEKLKAGPGTFLPLS
jgi:hypothetical protein